MDPGMVIAATHPLLAFGPQPKALDQLPGRAPVAGLEQARRQATRPQNAGPSFQSPYHVYRPGRCVVLPLAFRRLQRKSGRRNFLPVATTVGTLPELDPEVPKAQGCIAGAIAGVHGKLR